MRRMFLVLGCLAVLVFFAGSVFAADVPPGGGVTAQRAERREIREGREKFRVEHEQLEAERDKLTVECMNVKGQERATCDAKRHQLQEKTQVFHKRMKEFHKKVEAEHAAHPNKEWKRRPPSLTTPSQPPAQN